MRAKRSTRSVKTLDMSNYKNWSVAALKQALRTEANIVVPNSIGLYVCRKLYEENVLNKARGEMGHKDSTTPRHARDENFGRPCVSGSNNVGHARTTSLTSTMPDTSQSAFNGQCMPNQAYDAEPDLLPEPGIQGRRDESYPVAGRQQDEPGSCEILRRDRPRANVNVNQDDRPSIGNTMIQASMESPRMNTSPSAMSSARNLTDDVTAPTTGIASSRPGSSGDGNMNLAILNTLTQTVAGLQTIVTNLVGNKPAATDDAVPLPNHDLASYYRSIGGQAGHASSPNVSNSTPAGISSTLTATNFACLNPTSTFGVAPDDVPHMDLVSPTLRKHIIEGRDVNLCTLLIPYYETRNDDVRLKRSLNLNEFITAFGRYKRIMSSAYPVRREELERYEATIIGIHNAFGANFYEYHKQFSLKSANALQLYGIKVDWSKTDRVLLQLVTAGQKAKPCEICGEISHDTKFCPCTSESSSLTVASGYQGNSEAIYRPTLNSVPRHAQTGSSTDKHGRPRIPYQGGEICNNFNSVEGCARSTASCFFTHVCIRCKSKKHGIQSCAYQVNNAEETSPGSRPNVNSLADPNKQNNAATTNKKKNKSKGPSPNQA
jgi:hypothetical protein